MNANRSNDLTLLVVSQRHWDINIPGTVTASLSLTEKSCYRHAGKVRGEVELTMNQTAGEASKEEEEGQAQVC